MSLFFTSHSIFFVEYALASTKIQTSKIQDLFPFLVLTDYIALFKFLVCMEKDFPVYKIANTSKIWWTNNIVVLETL